MYGTPETVHQLTQDITDGKFLTDGNESDDWVKKTCFYENLTSEVGQNSMVQTRTDTKPPFKENVDCILAVKRILLDQKRKKSKKHKHITLFNTSIEFILIKGYCNNCRNVQRLLLWIFIVHWPFYFQYQVKVLLTMYYFENEITIFQHFDSNYCCTVRFYSKNFIRQQALIFKKRRPLQTVFC